jgi:hypothetical protein
MMASRSRCTDATPRKVLCRRMEPTCHSSAGRRARYREAVQLSLPVRHGSGNLLGGCAAAGHGLLGSAHVDLLRVCHRPPGMIRRLDTTRPAQLRLAICAVAASFVAILNA